MKKSGSEKIAYKIWSGGGERGTFEIKTLTEMGLKRVLTRERCNGDRWAHAAPAKYDLCCAESKDYYNNYKN